ncbi:metallophosphoesterase family protein [uncultured Pelagimonas sp.]|uniref:metallophosphoesterase family protein n=1 Tax=uncultured Pelagimonas sp. TaxID=1618102 RepID=UPI002616639F|nr:metallophosphoesterase family protein [uncultured Pelagimonas sp.]
MRFFRKRKVERPKFSAELAPEVPFFAIGDIHGSDHLLEALLGKLSDVGHPDAVLICVGDYVDRGEQSEQVLRRLFEMQSEAGPLMTCLMGNHEDMMLSFLDDPVANGARWLRYGGLQTLASFKISSLPGAAALDTQWHSLRDRFKNALGEDLEAWLRELPSHWATGNVAVVHAGADPKQPIERQDRSRLLWGHPEFDNQLRQDGVWVVHGHTIVDAAEAKDGRIAVDTGAYATGKLTAALVEKGNVSFVST